MTLVFSHNPNRVDGWQRRFNTAGSVGIMSLTSTISNALRGQPNAKRPMPKQPHKFRVILNRDIANAGHSITEAARSIMSSGRTVNRSVFSLCDRLIAQPPISIPLFIVDLRHLCSATRPSCEDLAWLRSFAVNGPLQCRVAHLGE